MLAWQVGHRQEPAPAERQEAARPVDVITLEPVTLVPRALGYGTASPATVWTAVAEVGGVIVERHPRLERGRLLPAGTVLFRIDPSDYRLEVAELEAAVQAADAQLAELNVRRANAEASLAIERQALDLAEADLARARRLLANGNISQSAVDEARRDVLTTRLRVQDLENQVALLPAERAVLEAERARQQADLARARLDLERTRVLLPIDARIASVEVERDQFVAAGQELAKADGIERAEIDAQVGLDALAPLVERSLDLSTLTPEEMTRLPQRLGLDAEVRLDVGALSAAWPARFERISDIIDPQTRTVGVIVSVEDPYRKAIPGRRPPLAKGLYVEVELRGAPRPGAIVVPRTALSRTADGETVVQVVDDDDRLRRRAVIVGFEQDDLALILDGLAAGDRLVVTDLIPAIEGMRLAPDQDVALAQRLRRQAEGISLQAATRPETE